MRVLESEGFKVTYMPVQKNGLIDLKVTKEKSEDFKRENCICKELESILTPGTSLCSVMMVNNEIGVRQPIKEIGMTNFAKELSFLC